MKTIVIGDRGPAVIEIRAALQHHRLLPSGDAGLDPRDPFAALYDDACAAAVQAFQTEHGLLATGEVDDDTYRELLTSRFALGDRTLLFAPGAMQRGADVRHLQLRLTELGFDTGNCDGIFGPHTARAVSAFQREVGIVTDGVCGSETMIALGRLGPKVTGGSPARLRAAAARLRSGPALRGRRLVIDPAPVAGLPADPQADGLIWDIAVRIQDRLAALGAEPTLTLRSSSQPPPRSAERASRANDLGAELFISLHVAGMTTPQTEGVATYYFGSSREHCSAVGQELAELVHRELLARTPFTDLGAHPRMFEILRQTSMPAVHLEVGYPETGSDLHRLSEAQVRDAIAEGVVAAIQRLYLPRGEDYPTGSWSAVGVTG